MKRLSIFFCLLLAFALAGCGTTGTTGAAASPLQTAMANTTNGYNAVDQAILAADTAVKANALKGKDAANTIAALSAAKTALDAARTSINSAIAAQAASAPAK